LSTIEPNIRSIYTLYEDRTDHHGHTGVARHHHGSHILIQGGPKTPSRPVPAVAKIYAQEKITVAYPAGACYNSPVSDTWQPWVTECESGSRPTPSRMGVMSLSHQFSVARTDQEHQFSVARSDKIQIERLGELV